jgi:sugar-specific transcriptional regulator TrmB
MNTETLDLVSNVIEELIAAIPQIVVVLTTVVYGLKSIKSRVNAFPKQMEETKLQLSNAFTATKKDMLVVVDEVTKKIESGVESSLSNMAKELETYKQHLQSESDQVNMLVRQNKTFVELLSNLATKEPQRLLDDVSKVVAQRTILSKQELENYPAVLIKELPMLERALKEALVVLGEEALKEILGKIGYGKGN